MQVFTAEVDKLADDLGNTRDDLMDRCERVTQHWIDEIKDHAAGLIRGHGTLPHLPRSFTSEVERSRWEVQGEAGGDWSRPQGRLDVYIEYGTPTSSAIPHWQPAGDILGPRWQRAIEDAAEAVVLR